MWQLVSPCSDELPPALFLVDLLQNHSVYRQLSTFQSDLKIRITSKRRRVPSSVFNNRTVANKDGWNTVGPFYVDRWMCFCVFQVFQVIQAVDNHDARHQIHRCPWNARFEFDPGPQPSQELQTVLALLHCDATISPYKVLYQYTVTYSDIDVDDVHECIAPSIAAHSQTSHSQTSWRKSCRMVLCCPKLPHRKIWPVMQRSGFGRTSAFGRQVWQFAQFAKEVRMRISHSRV